MLLICWKCLKPISEIPIRIGFRAACPHCSSDLHVCKNCRYYSLGKPNDCLVPGTEPIRDREAANFCEEYKPLLPSAHSTSSSDQASCLLGEIEKKPDFKSLFKDD
ncbi:MAG TPA: hypothetical protein VLE95_07315 [Chlamydiales bacterium]|nr:hypothetical protein [Chlamydiales bacterium]